MLPKPHIKQPLAIDPAWLPPGGIEALAEKHHVTGRKRTIPAAVKWSAGERRQLRRKKQIRPSVWAERHRVLPADAAIPGRWKNSTTPYLAGIMDASFFPSVQEIIICAPPQTGKSDCVNNCVGYGTDRRPGNVMVVYPDEVTARDNSKDRLQPMYSDSPRLRQYLTGYQDDQSALKIKLKNLIIYMAWANSAARLGNRPLPYVVLDEEDKYPATATKKEASPTNLAKKRTRTFSHMRKIWRVSTPTVEAGPIWQALENDAQVVFVYYVRCPDCGTFQLMDFENIKWPGGKGANPNQVEAEKQARYHCTGCSAQWDDAKRNAAARAGQWRDRNRGISLDTWLKSYRPQKIGFHYPAWISSFVSMSESAAQFIKGQKDKNELKDFQNAHKAVPWKAYIQQSTTDGIKNLKDTRPRGAVPGGGIVAGLTAGVDTQKYGFWYEVRAWGYGIKPDSWQIREGFVTNFKALADVLWHHQYTDADGNPYLVHFTVQDAMGSSAGGFSTRDVYQFCNAHPGAILPSQGKDRLTAPFAYSQIEYYPGKTERIPGGLRLVRVNTTHYKNELASRLAVQPGDPGAWYFHSETTDEWAAHMVAETLDEEKGIWINPKNRDNHGFDCSVLALVAADIIGIPYWTPEDIEDEDDDDDELTPAAGSPWVSPAGGSWMQGI